MKNTNENTKKRYFVSYFFFNFSKKIATKRKKFRYAFIKKKIYIYIKECLSVDIFPANP